MPEDLELSAIAWAASDFAEWIQKISPLRLAERVRVVLTYLGSRVNWKRGQADRPIPTEQIAKVCGMHVRNVQQALAALRASGWIAPMATKAAGVFYAVRHPEAPPLVAEPALPRRRRPPQPRATPEGERVQGASTASEQPVSHPAPAEAVREVLQEYEVRFVAARRQLPPISQRERNAARDGVRRYGLDAMLLAIRNAYAHAWFSSRASILSIAADPGRYGPTYVSDRPRRIQQASYTPLEVDAPAQGPPLAAGA